MRKRPLVLMACSFVAGICFGIYGGFLPFAVAGGLMGYGCWAMFLKRRWPWLLARGIGLALVFLLGAGQAKSQLELRQQELSQIKDGELLILTGELYKKEYKNYNYLYYLKACYFTNGAGKVMCNRVLCYSEADCCLIGESLTVQGKVHMFTQARNEGGFDQQSFYRSQKIDFSLRNIRIMQQDRKEDSLREGLFRLRKEFAAVYRENLSPANAGVLSAMLLGEKSQMDEEVKAAYQSAGISHILAISGLHVSLLGMALYRLLRGRGIGFFGAFCWAGVFLLLYACMTGESVSTQRAVGMLLLAMFADVLGRGYDSLNALGGMTIWLLWENPFLLEYAGFMFSVVAVVGITTTGKLLQEEPERQEKQHLQISLGDRWKESKIRQKAKGMFWGSLGVWLTTVPLTAFYYYEIPVYSVLLNLAVLPLLKVLFAFGFAGAVGGKIFPGIGKLLLFPCEQILNVYDGLADFVLQLPGSVCIVGKPSVEKLVCYYGLLALICGWCCRKKKKMQEEEPEVLHKHEPGEKDHRLWKRKRGFRIGRAVGTTLLLLIFFWPAARRFEVDALDVGQGDGIYICTREGVSLFIDGGSSDVNQVGKYRILPFLKSKGITHISYWFVSHGDKDHISGLLEIMEEGYRIDNLVVSAASFAQEEKLRKAALACGINIIEMETQDQLCLGETTIICLSPDGDCVSGDRNELSLVLYYRDSMFSGLFAGDISEKTERRLAQEGICENIHLYKAIHHGSRYSNSKEFLQLLSPQVGLVSCGRNNSYGHPSGEALLHMEEAGAKVFRTDQGGQIKVIMQHDQLIVEEFVSH